MIVFTAVAYDKPVQNTIEIDESLFAKIAKGESASFERLYLLCKDVVFSYTLSTLRNPYDADDAASEVFLKIRSAAHLYKPSGKPMAWIFTITRNVCLMKLREQKKYSELNDIAAGQGFDIIPDIEDRLVLETSLKILGENEMKIIMLHAVAGMKHREIADLLNKPLSTVLSRYNRGIKKLRKELEKAL